MAPASSRVAMRARNCSDAWAKCRFIPMLHGAAASGACDNAGVARAIFLSIFSLPLMQPVHRVSSL